MNEETLLLSDLDLPYKSSETQLKSVGELKRSLKLNALSVLEVYSELPKLPELRSAEGELEGSFRDNNSDSCDMDHSDLSDNTNSSIDCNRWTVNCLETYDELKNKCQHLGLRFVDYSEDNQANRRYLISVSNKPNLTVQCLFSYEELLKECEGLRLKFVNSPLCDHQANRSVSNMLDLAVKCLFSYEELVKKSEGLGLKFVDCSPSDKVYEVDLIIEDKIEEGQKYYLVKWKNYHMKTNTWEPDYNLTGCGDMIHYYETLKKPGNLFNKNILSYFIRELASRKPYDILILVKIVSFVTGTSENSVKKMNSTLTELKLKSKGILDMPLRKLQCHKNKLWEIMRFAEKRKLVLIDLKEWEYDINSFNPATYIEVENNVDLEKAPIDFQFIHDYVADGIEIFGEPAIFCECNDCLKSKSMCCPDDSDAHFAYNKFRRLQLLPGYPIYECNKRCKCDKDCVNRVVQHGPKVKVAIFRTSNGCGWGLKALEIIQKDQFVLEYLGEILTSDAAEIRGREYDNVGRSYLFDLDYGEENCQYTVDAGHVGNASHFINHSCEPNLHVFAVWINNQDPQLPRLAFFAKKKINRGEELTFDYKMVKTRGEDGFGSSPKFEGKVLCKCNARKCRKYLC